MGSLKNSPLRDFHVEMDAKMVPYAGWNIPLHYADGAAAEHKYTRSDCSIFDLSFLSEFRAAGEKAPEALDRLFARPVSYLKIGESQINFLLNAEGGVMDILMIFRMGEKDFFLTGNPECHDGDTNHFQTYCKGDFSDFTGGLARIAVCGPKTQEVMEKLGVKQETLPAGHHHTMAEIDGLRCILSATGYTGETGFEICLGAEYADELWDQLLETEIAFPAGMAARDTLRLEAGFLRYGSEVRKEWPPADSGILIDLDSDRDFIGKKALQNRPVQRRVISVLLEGHKAPRVSSPVLDATGNPIGIVTSGAFCPTLGKAAALCSVEIPAAPGSTVQISGDSGTLSGTVAELPFLKKANNK